MFADTTGFFVLLIYSLAVGAVLGVFFDILMLAVDMIAPAIKKTEKSRILPHEKKQAERALFPIDTRVTPRDILLFVADILFCTVSAFAVIILIYHLNYGEVRVFSLVSAVAGYIIYRKTLGKPVCYFTKKLIMLLIKLIKTVLKFIRKAVLVILKPLIVLIKRTIMPVMQSFKAEKTKKRAEKILLLMEASEEKRTKKRKQNNEKDQGIRADR